MFKKTIIIIVSILFLSISTINYASDPPTYVDLKPFYPEILYENLDNYEYTIDDIGNDFYLVKINGVIYIVQK